MTHIIIISFYLFFIWMPRGFLIIVNIHTSTSQLRLLIITNNSEVYFFFSFIASFLCYPANNTKKYMWYKIYLKCFYENEQKSVKETSESYVPVCMLALLSELCHTLKKNSFKISIRRFRELIFVADTQKVILLWPHVLTSSSTPKMVQTCPYRNFFLSSSFFRINMKMIKPSSLQ